MLDPSQISAEAARSMIAPWLASQVAPSVRTEVEAAVGAVCEAATDAELVALMVAFQACGEGWKLHPADPVAQRITPAFMGPLIPSWEVEGLDHLDAALALGPVLLLSNHFSYVDTQATDALLRWSGRPELALSMVAVSGPKVYSSTFRRMASVCLNTLKTAQSSRLSHNEAELSPREVARIAIESMREAGALAASGRPVLIYAEGSRSRTGRLQPFLKAVARYGRPAGTRMVPLAITGTDQLYAVDAPLMSPAPVRVVFGEPVVVADLGPAEALVETWRRVAAALPPHQQPSPDTPAVA